MSKFTLHFDGSCWVNPGGTSAYGIVLEKEHLVNGTPYTWNTICEEAGVIGTGPEQSNNVAEFHALAVGLQRYLEYGGVKGDRIEVYGDSNLVIKMMLGDYRPNPSKLYYPAYKEAFRLLSVIEITIGAEISFTWIPREQNTRCDDLSKEHNKTPK